MYLGLFSEQAVKTRLIPMSKNRLEILLLIGWLINSRRKVTTKI